MRWVGYVARMEKTEVHTGFWWGDVREGDHLGDPGVDGRIILKWIFKKWDGAWKGISTTSQKILYFIEFAENYLSSLTSYFLSFCHK
jgi:hypothetical protein